VLQTRHLDTSGGALAKNDRVEEHSRNLLPMPVAGPAFPCIFRVGSLFRAVDKQSSCGLYEILIVD
jgi:hypothetical protein